MKKNVIIFFLAILILFPLISAVQFDINQNFSQGETIIAKLSGNFLSPITNDNVLFFKGHVQIPMVYNVLKLGNDYYLYASTAGKSPDNYSVSVQNVQYTKGTGVSSDNLAANFSILNTTAAFSVNPGAVSTSGDFSIDIQNLLDNSINVDLDTGTNSSVREIFVSGSQTASFSLDSGEKKTIDLTLGDGISGLRTIKLELGNFSYQIPVYILSSSNPIPTQSSFGMDPPVLSISLPTNTTIKRAVLFYNLGSIDLNNVSLSLSDSLTSSMNLSSSMINTLTSKSGTPLDLSFFSSYAGTVEGYLKLKSGEVSNSFYISLNFVNNYTNYNKTESILTKTCSEYNGTVCSSDEQCDRTPIYAKDNVCCLGSCIQSQIGSSGQTIGIILLVVVLVIIIFFYLKYKKTKRKPVNLLEEAKGKKFLNK